MVVLHLLTGNPALTPATQSLFRAYADFLRDLSACHAFDFDRFEHEIADLPHPYISRNGDLLLALDDDRTPVACIAFRAPYTAFDPHTCELKRLFVLPSHRGQGIAERLVLSALDHARSRGFRSAVLDTEPSTMQPAYALYTKLGFTEYTPDTLPTSAGTLNLRKVLLGAAPFDPTPDTRYTP